MFLTQFSISIISSQKSEELLENIWVRVQSVQGCACFPCCQENSRWRRLVMKFGNFMSRECVFLFTFCVELFKTVLILLLCCFAFFKNRCYLENTSVKVVVTLLVWAFTIHVQINISLALQSCQADYEKGNAAHNRYWYQCIAIALKPRLSSVELLISISYHKLTSLRRSHNQNCWNLVMSKLLLVSVQYYRECKLLQLEGLLQNRC